MKLVITLGAEDRTTANGACSVARTAAPDDLKRKDWSAELAERASRKERTHSLIIDEAARSMRLYGVQGVGLNSLMKRVGRTHGAFYSHFQSWDELIGAAIERMFEATTRLIDRFLLLEDAGKGLAGFIDHYLSDAVRLHPERSCPVPSLSSEASRLPDSGRRHFLAGVDMLHVAIANSLAALKKDDPEALACSILFEMAGAMAMARVGMDDERGSALLQASRSQLKRRLGIDAGASDMSEPI